MAPPVILLHGFGTSGRTTWSDNGWVDLLTDMGREAITIDLLGHGEAPKPHDPEAYDELESQVLAQLPEEPVQGIGFSLGGRVLLTLAGLHPDRFERIIVAGIGANLFRDEDPDALATLLESDAPPTDHPMGRYFQQLARGEGADPKALAAYLRRPHPTPVTDELLANITCPVLVVMGTEDFAGPADPLVERLPDVEVVELPRVDHFATPKSMAFLDAALEFLDAVPV
jgi:pimeloyl-ACP methyl ester carboxylesterase